MIKFNLDFDFDDIVDALEDKAKRIEEEASKVVMQAGYKTERDAKTLAPVETGTLRRSIHMDLKDALTAEVGTNIEYATFVEFGTVKMPAQPFMTPAYHKNRDDFVKKMADLGGDL